MTEPRINFIGIGAQKCASTWVHEVLNAHPQAALSSPKELDYFSYYYDRGHDWYESVFDATTAHLAVGDNSPSYFPHPSAPLRAFRYNPDLRIILTLRDPVERAFSNHLHVVREGFVSGEDLSFERGLTRNGMYIEQSRYATHLRRWLEYFPRERIHVILQEDVSVRPAEILNSLYRFLGLREEFEPLLPSGRINESSVSTQPRVDAVLRGAAGVMRGLGMGGLVQLAKRNPTVGRLRQTTRVGLREIVPPMKDETRRRVVSLLVGEVEDLCALLGRQSLPWHSFAEIWSSSREADAP
jgi:hypothetical protein